MGCKRYQRRYQEFWMSTDTKPRGKDRRSIEKQNRQEAKRDIEKEIKEIEEDDLQLD